MPKRVLDFDAMWGSDKLASCAAWAQAEYAWLYGLADASGCFELTNLRVIWGRVAAIRGNLSMERLEQIFAEFQDKGLLFVWEHEGKRYAHWTGSDVPGRLPPPSWRMRLEKFAPPVPRQRLAEYMSRFARGRAALGGVGFRAEGQREYSPRNEHLKFEISDLKEERGNGSRGPRGQMPEQRVQFADHAQQGGTRKLETQGSGDLCGNPQFGLWPTKETVQGQGGTNHESRDSEGESGLKARVEGAQAQDLGLDRNLEGDWGLEGGAKRRGAGDGYVCGDEGRQEKDFKKAYFYNSNSQSNTNSQGLTPKDLAVARELRVGQGPVCGPGRVKPEVLERIRRREAARAGSRSP